ncbi:MAG: zinc dependent phospholipase C family protein [Flavisolibacter sp.]
MQKIYFTRIGKKKPLNSIKRIWIVCLFLFISYSSKAYSVLTHQALIDANWKAVLLPLLQKKYPAASAEQLKTAKAYAYGGAVAPDMGYFPYGSKLFTNLVHYVRSGDFVESLFDEAQNMNDYAFALGVLCHYMADTYGHPLGVNKSVPLEYPKMKKKFGTIVTYAENKISHIRTEFGFDVLQTARGNYASDSYHDFIGFAVADTLLGKAVLKTYGLSLNELFANLPLAIGTFRWAVRNVFPTITKTAWALKRTEIEKAQPGITARKFIYSMKRKQYNAEFGNKRTKPDFFSFLLSSLIQFLPKVGPLRALNFEVPDPEVEKIFIQSFDTVSKKYVQVLKNNVTNINLANKDFDTGKPTQLGEYPLCDETYKELLFKLKDDGFTSVSDLLKNNIINFYATDTGGAKTNSKDWPQINEALTALKSAKIN